MWIWRLVGWCYAAAVQAYFFHGPIKIGYPALLFPFTVYLFFGWNGRLHTSNTPAPPRGLEWAGGWSYSMYLMHGTVFAALQALAGTWEPTAFWIFKWLGVLLVSYTFFVLAEQPAQHLARNLGYRLSGTRPDSSG